MHRKCYSPIVRELKQEGITFQYGRRWTSWTIRYLLRNEHNIGNNIYNRTNFRLGLKPKANRPEFWIGLPASFDPIVDPAISTGAKDCRAAAAGTIQCAAYGL